MTESMGEISELPGAKTRALHVKACLQDRTVRSKRDRLKSKEKREKDEQSS